MCLENGGHNEKWEHAERVKSRPLPENRSCGLSLFPIIIAISTMICNNIIVILVAKVIFSRVFEEFGRVKGLKPENWL